MGSLVLSGLALASVIAGSAPKIDVSLAAPFAVSANGKAIMLEVGHAAPLMADMNGDGLGDLVVGQFAQGIALVYLNSGTATEPRFTTRTVLQAGGKNAAVSYG
jgi:hypothetical protein